MSRRDSTPEAREELEAQPPSSSRDSAPALCRERALKLLARRSHFRREMERKLRQRGFDEETIAAAVDRLESDGLMDELETCRAFARERFRRGFGRRRVEQDLLRRGGDRDAVATVLGEVDDDEEVERARRALESWRRRGGDDRGALLRHLERKGFETRVILMVEAESPLDPDV